MVSLVDFLKNNPMPNPGPQLKVGDRSTEKTINGRIYETITRANGTKIETDITDYKKWDDQRQELLEKEFPDNLPFSICLSDDDLINLHGPFTQEPVIFIRDNRANEHSYMWQNVSEQERNRYNSNFRVKKQGDRAITLRQIILEMSRVAEYRLIEQTGEEHCFLEGFDQTSPIQYVTSFGS